MFFSFTGLSYLTLFISLSFLTFRFFQYWRQKKDTTSKLFLLLIIPLFLFAFIRTITPLFFLENIQIITFSIILVAFLESLTAAVVAYLIVYLKFPKISPWVGFSIIFFLGIIVTILTANISYSPTIEEKGVIDWGFPSSEVGIIYSILRLVIVLATFIPLIIIVFQQFLYSEDAFLKKRSLGLTLVLILGMLLGFIDFILNNILGIKAAIYRDYTTIIISFLLFLVIFLTQKPETSKL